ncbi:hypothetical protein FRA_50c15230 [Francisella sp. W12-1067]|nr:hypothetical protein FRA_50c15230 [Francisella sp. W12-1067]
MLTIKNLSEIKQSLFKCLTNNEYSMFCPKAKSTLETYIKVTKNPYTMVRGFDYICTMPALDKTYTTNPISIYVSELELKQMQDCIRNLRFCIDQLDDRINQYNLLRKILRATSNFMMEMGYQLEMPNGKQPRGRFGRRLIYVHSVYLGNLPKDFNELALKVTSHFERTWGNLSSQLKHDIKYVLWHQKSAIGTIPMSRQNSFEIRDISSLLEEPDLNQDLEIVLSRHTDKKRKLTLKRLLTEQLTFASNFQSVTPALSADILRFVILYLYGGIYLDYGYAPVSPEVQLPTNKNSIKQHLNESCEKDVIKPWFSANNLKFIGQSKGCVPICRKVDQGKFIGVYDYYEAANACFENSDYEYYKFLAVNLDSNAMVSYYARHPVLLYIIMSSNALLNKELNTNFGHSWRDKYINTRHQDGLVERLYEIKELMRKQKNEDDEDDDEDDEDENENEELKRLRKTIDTVNKGPTLSSLGQYPGIITNVGIISYSLYNLGYLNLDEDVTDFWVEHDDKYYKEFNFILNMDLIGKYENGNLYLGSSGLMLVKTSLGSWRKGLYKKGFSLL